MLKLFLKCLARVWMVHFAFLALAILVVFGLIRITDVSPQKVLDVSTTGTQKISMPILETVETSALPDALGYVLVNGGVVLVLFAIVFSLRLMDPAKSDCFPKTLRRLILKDPSLSLFKLLPRLRRVETEELRPLIPVFVLVPYVVPAAVAALIGAVLTVFVVTLSAQHPGNASEIPLVAMAFVFPHGVFELTGLFIPMALLLTLYGKVKPDLFENRSGEVWTALRDHLAFRAVAPFLGAALALIIVAAVIESYATEPIAKGVMRALGVDLFP